MTTGSRFLLTNGVVLQSSDTPSVVTFLETHPGAYTTSRTHNNASCLLFWERHLQRLENSVKILLSSNPKLLLTSSKSIHPLSALSIQTSVWESVVRPLLDDSMHKVLPRALRERNAGQELAITALVSGNAEKFGDIEDMSRESFSGVFDLHVHVGTFVPPVFGSRENGAHLAVVGRGRDIAAAKYSDWVRLRKPLERLRPPSVTELLLSNDGNHILEGCLTNFFVVCRMDNRGVYPFEVQTAPIGAGVLPGVLRQLVIEVCLSKGIPVREVAPSWSDSEIWEEAFITNSLRLVQHVETIRVPSPLESLQSKNWNEIVWEEKLFEVTPGIITAIIQKEIMKSACLEAYSLSMNKFHETGV